MTVNLGSPYFEATELNTPPTRDSFNDSGTDWKPKCVSGSTCCCCCFEADPADPDDPDNGLLLELPLEDAAVKGELDDVDVIVSDEVTGGGGTLAVVVVVDGSDLADPQNERVEGPLVQTEHDGDGFADWRITRNAVERVNDMFDHSNDIS
jgi:hypothetical protein